MVILAGQEHQGTHFKNSPQLRVGLFICWVMFRWKDQCCPIEDQYQTHNWFQDFQNTNHETYPPSPPKNTALGDGRQAPLQIAELFY